MLSDDSSSDSETGRFKGRSEKQEQRKSSHQKDNTKSSGRSRPSDNSRFRREFDRRRDERDSFDRRSRERHRHARHSPVGRRHSRERSHSKRSPPRERPKHSRHSTERSKPREQRHSSRDKRGSSRSGSLRSPEHKRDLKDEILNHISIKEKHRAKDPIAEKSKNTNVEKPKDVEKTKPRNLEKSRGKSREKKSSSPDYKGKRSVVHKPTHTETTKRKTISPIVVDENAASDVSEEVQPGSYYSMIPAVIKEKSEESSEIDSSDDERLRAKLLNLERELHKTRKKKHRKKHKRRSSKSSKDRDREASVSVEVSSTTDIQSKDKSDVANTEAEAVEVTSTQKRESSEEGEILSDDSKNDIDPTDLRHKLKRSAPKINSQGSPDLRDMLKSKLDVCGPALPPHLEKRYRQSKSPDAEEPGLPPRHHKKDRNIGPHIPDKMRKVLAENEQEVIKCESSDEDNGIGPLPAGEDKKMSEAHQRLEERALDMKLKQLDGRSLKSSDVKSREKWMLELPEGKAKYLGLEARTFRAKEGPDMSDRSSWTDTPEAKARKAAGLPTEEDAHVSLQREAKARQIAARDDDYEKAVKKHKKKHRREESLLELHQKKLKKKKKKDDKDEEKQERRPFSRDVDLQVNRFDEAQKKSIIKKAQGLNSRFSSGEAKYL